MKSGLLVAIAIIVATTVSASARTVQLSGIHPAKKVEAMCKSYGGNFLKGRTGHGCAKSGYGRVWCSAAGKCIARLEDGFKLAQK